MNLPEGSYVAGSAVYTVEEMDEQIFRFATGHGYRGHFDPEWHSESADEAISWLNEHVAAEGQVFVLDDGLSLVDADEAKEEM
jgi:hypothetical protein